MILFLKYGLFDHFTINISKPRILGVQVIFILVFACHTLKEAHLRAVDGPDRHPHARAASGIPEIAQYAPRGVIG